ncbi:uncharacterized protein LOC109140823 [Tachysurus ichikawai]
MNAVCPCGKICKNARGLKIHQSQMKCLEQRQAPQCTGLVPGESEEEQGPEAPHRAQSLQVVQTDPPVMQPENRRIRWPQACKTAEWQMFDDNVDKVPEATAKGDAERRLQTMTAIIVRLAVERFGVEEGRGVKKPYTKNQRKLLTLRRAEQHRRRRRERARRRAAFIRNPFEFTKQLLGQKKGGRLVSSKEEIDQHLSNTFSDPSREQELRQCDAFITPSEPVEAFDLREPLLKELLQRLWRILKVSWRKGKTLKECQFAEGVWIPKEVDSKTISQFRIISLLSVEGKIFFSIVAKRLAEFFLKNGYIDTSVQKGGIPGVPGCLEHTGVVTQLLREAKENRGNLVVLWLDLANAYGSIPHKLVQEALERHHVPVIVRNLIQDYYSDFKLRVSSGSITSEWHRLEVGIITGCTISVILFALAMNMLVKSAEPECRGPKSKTGIWQPPIRAFMDDLTVTVESVPRARWILKGLERLIEWARMSFKPAKSRSLVLKKGRVVEKFRFTISGTQIPTLSEKPVKRLGKTFDRSLRDTTSIRNTSEELESFRLPPSQNWKGESAASYQRRLRGGSGSKEQIRGQMLLGHKLRLDQPQLGHLKEGVCSFERPETPNEIRNITDDVP